MDAAQIETDKVESLISLRVEKGRIVRRDGNAVGGECRTVSFEKSGDSVPQCGIVELVFCRNPVLHHLAIKLLGGPKLNDKLQAASAVTFGEAGLQKCMQRILWIGKLFQLYAKRKEEGTAQFFRCLDRY